MSSGRPRRPGRPRSPGRRTARSPCTRGRPAAWRRSAGSRSACRSRAGRRGVEVRRPPRVLPSGEIAESITPLVGVRDVGDEACPCSSPWRRARTASSTSTGRCRTRAGPVGAEREDRLAVGRPVDGLEHVEAGLDEALRACRSLVTWSRHSPGRGVRWALVAEHRDHVLVDGRRPGQVAELVARRVTATAVRVGLRQVLDEHAPVADVGDLRAVGARTSGRCRASGPWRPPAGACRRAVGEQDVLAVVVGQLREAAGDDQLDLRARGGLGPGGRDGARSACPSSSARTG